MKLNKKALQFDLQFFADSVDEGGEPNTPATPQSGNAQPDTPPEPKTYTEADLQKETDRRVTQALKKSQEKWQQEFQQKLEQEKQEAERLAKMSAEQREKELFAKQQEEFSKQKREFERERLTTQTLKTLAIEDLPSEFCDMIMANVETAEDIMTNIKTFKKVFSEAVEKRILDRTQTTTPGAGAQQKPTNDDPFLKGLGL